MLIPLPSRRTMSAPRAPVAFYSERLDADHDRFSAAQRRAAWRFGVYAVFGAAIIVGIGVWGFGKETNTTNLPPLRVTSRPPASTVMMVIHPG